MTELKYISVFTPN